jgi:hypothetical protein
LGRKNKHWSIRQVGRIFHVLFSISEPLHSPSLSLCLSLSRLSYFGDDETGCTG